MAQVDTADPPLSELRRIEVTVNGRRHVAEVPHRLTFVDFLRENLSLTGTHVGCEQGVCGACTVLMDGEPVRSCLMFAVQADGLEFTTVEGLSEPGELNTLQRCFRAHHALQCGFCTPGMLVAATALLRECPTPDEDQARDAISGHLCRCTGYVPIVEAIVEAGRQSSVTQQSKVQA